MLEAYPRGIDVDGTKLVAAIEALEDCANACTQCADACLSEQDLASLARCIRLNLDCADICTATGRVIFRQTESDANLARPLLEACASCADECERHASHMEHCRIYAESCRSCQTACQELLDAIR
jgi:hypothetical protein